MNNNNEKVFFINLREKKLFNVKGHNPDKVKVTVIWVPLLRNIKEKRTLHRVKAPDLEPGRDATCEWLGSQETSENIHGEHLRQPCDHHTNQVWADIGLGNKAQPTSKMLWLKWPPGKYKILLNILLKIYCWLECQFYIIHNLQLNLYLAPFPKNLIFNDNFSLDVNIPSSGLFPGGIEMMKSKQAHSH